MIYECIQFIVRTATDWFAVAFWSFPFGKFEIWSRMQISRSGQFRWYWCLEDENCMHSGMAISKKHTWASCFSRTLQLLSVVGQKFCSDSWIVNSMLTERCSVRMYCKKTGGIRSVEIGTDRCPNYWCPKIWSGMSVGGWQWCIITHSRSSATTVVR